jgi:O-antigen/teichoic acid export membrane protein
MIKKLISDTLFYAVGPRVGLLLGIFILPFITKKLTADDYVIYGLIIAVSGLLEALRELGLSVVRANSYFHRKKSFRLIWGNILGFNLVYAIPYGLFYGFSLYYLAYNGSLKDEVTLYGFVLLIFDILVMYPYISMGNQFLQYENKAKAAGLIAALTGLASVLLNFFFIFELEWGFNGWIYGNAIARFISFVIFIVLMTRNGIHPIFRFNKEAFRSYFQLSLPLLPHGYGLFLINSVDRIVLKIVGCPENEFGRYNLAYNFANYGEFGTNALGTASSPALYRFLQLGGHVAEIRRLVNIGFYISLFVCFLASAWIHEILAVLIRNPDLLAIDNLVIILCFSFISRPVYMYLSTVFVNFKKTKKIWRVSLGAGLLNLGINFLIYPYLGVIGIAISTFIAFQVLAYAGGLLKEYGHSPYRLPFTFYLVVTILALVLAVWSNQQAFPVKVLISVVAIAWMVITCKRVLKIKPVAA